MSSNRPVTHGELDQRLEHYHRYRWILVDVWIVIFTALVFWGIIEIRMVVSNNHRAISALTNTKASVVSLQRTNCGLREFLKTAEIARIDQAQQSEGVARAQNLQAARNYFSLAQFFTNEDCSNDLPKVPKK